MDHVNNNLSSTMGGQGYNAENSMDQLDPSLIDTSSWPSHNQFQLQQENYAPQQDFAQYPNNSHSIPNYSQFSTPQAPQHHPSPYANYYATQYQQPQHGSPYGASTYSLTSAPQPQAQNIQRPQPQTSFSSHSGNYSSHNSNLPTISPASLAMNEYSQSRQINNMPNSFQQQPVYSAQTWPQASESTYRRTESPILPPSAYSQLKPSLKPMEQAPPVSTAAVSTPVVSKPTISAPAVSTSPLYQQQTQKIRQAKPPRIIDQEAFNLIPAMNFVQHAPWLTVGDKPSDHVIVGKSDIPKYKARKSRSGRAIVPGLDIIAETTIPRVKSSSREAKAAKKVKSSALQARASPTKDARARVIADISLPTLARSPSAASSSSDEEENSSSDDNSSESEYEDSVPVEVLSDAYNRQVRQQLRPTKAAEAAAWDVTGILWVDRNRYAKREEINAAVPKFQEYITKARDDAKKATADVIAAEAEAPSSASVKKLTEIRDLKRHVLAKALESATKTGHPQILENLGISQRVVMVLSNALGECMKLKDYNGELPKAILALMAKFLGLTDTLLQKLKFDKIADSFKKRGDATIKQDVTKILASTPEAKERAKKSQEESVKLEKIRNGLAIQEKARAREEAAKVSVSSGGKRAHDGDGGHGKPTKKVASDATAVNATSKTAPSKIVTPAAKTGALFASLKKPVARPQTGSVTAAPLKKPDVPKSVAPSAPPPVPQSSLASLLASIEKPKEIPKKPDAPVRAPETLEQKTKRERKESRRHLRVRWKDGDALEEVRLFKHEQAEDEGRQDDMLRDAHDDRSEGLRLKQKLKGITVEDEDEDDYYGDISITARYSEPIGIDFSSLDDDSRKRNYTTRGGDVAFETPQQDVQKHREMLELMVIYTDSKDIPSTPKEPPYRRSEEGARERTFGHPKEDWINERLREIYKFGPERALDIMNAREVALQKHAESDRAHNQQLHNTSQQSTQAPDLSSLLDQIQTPQPATPQPATPAKAIMEPDKLAFLESICKYLSGKPFPAVEPPEWMTSEGKKEWYIGFNRDNAKKRALEAQQAAIAQSQLLPPQQLPQPPPQVPAPVQVQIPHIANPFPPPIPSFSQPPHNTFGQPHNSYDFGHYQQAPSVNAVQAPVQERPHNVSHQYAGYVPNTNGGLNYDDEEGEQGQDDYEYQAQQRWNDDFDSHSGGRGGGRKKKNKRNKHSDDNANMGMSMGMGVGSSMIPKDHGGDGMTDRYGRSISRANVEIPAATMPPSAKEREYKGKKKPCKFWMEGKCAKGAACGFLHD